MCALDRICTGEVTALTTQTTCELADPVFVDSCNRRGPRRSFGDAVSAPEYVVFECVEAGAVADEKFAVMVAGNDNLVRERQHQSCIGIRADRNPFRVQKIRTVRACRAHIDHWNTARSELPKPHFLRMLRRAAGTHLAVFQCEPAERDEYFAVLEDARPCGRAPGERAVSANHVRQQKLRGAPTVVADLVDRAAGGEIES